MMDSEDKKIDIEGVDPRELYGPQNIYLEQMQELHPNLKIIARGSSLTVLGPRSDSERFRKRLDGLIAYYLKYGYISKESVQQAFSTGVIEHDAPVDKDVIVYGNNGTIVRARTVNQLKLVQSYDRNDLLLAIGPAGSGKTYTAIALAVRALKEKHVKRIILTRPAVDAYSPETAEAFSRPPRWRPHPGLCQSVFRCPNAYTPHRHVRRRPGCRPHTSLPA